MAASNSKKLKIYVEVTHDHLSSGEIEPGIATAADGADFIRSVVKREGKSEALAASRDAGFNAAQAKALIDLTAQDRLPPSGLVRAMMKESVVDRAHGMREAVCSFETGRWVDGLVGDNKQREMPTTSELIEVAQSESNPFQCFILAVQIASRGVKTEFVGKMALYVMSEAFQADLSEFATGSPNTRAFKAVRDVFSHLDNIVTGEASEKEKAAFVKALSLRIESALCLNNGGAWKYTPQGPDGEAMLPPENGKTVSGSMHATANSSRGKAIKTAGSMRRNWLPGATKAEILRMMLVNEPIVPADETRLSAENKPLAKVALDVAVLQAAESVLAAAHDDIVPSILEGRTVVDGLFLSMGAYFEFNQTMFDTVRASVLTYKKSGYPPDTERGRETWLCALGVISSWAINHPESFPWFQDVEMKEWIKNCPFNAENEETIRAKRQALSEIGSTREEAIENVQGERAERARKEDSAPKTSGFSKLVEKKMVKQVKALIGTGKRYSQDSYDAQCLRAMLNEGDAEGIRLVAEENKPARKIREAHRREKAAG